MDKINLMVLPAIVLTISTFLGCNKKPSSEEFLFEFGTKFCYKIADCSQKSMEKVSPEERKMLEEIFPDRKRCDEEVQKDFSNKEKHRIVLTDQEIKAGQTCLNDLEKADCNHIEIPSCEKFNVILKTKDAAQKNSN